MTDGAVAFIEKPYRDDALADAVHKAMCQNTHFGQSPAQQAGQQGASSLAGNVDQVLSDAEIDRDIDRE